MKNIISCRPGPFGQLEEALPILVECGVTNAEVSVGAETDYAHIRSTAAAAAVTVTTLGLDLNLDDDASCRAFRRAAAGAAAIGTPALFCSLRSADPAGETATGRLRAALDCAADHGLTLNMETHPPFGTNADVALATLARVDHPALRYNLDTANLHYYNHNIDTITELRKCRDVVASVHLKETNGAYHNMAFPILGTGIVDFTEVFRLLNEIGFAGPFTMELEGPTLDGHDEGKIDFLRRCIDHLRGIGVM